MPDLLIRPAAPTDVADLHRLVAELAAYVGKSRMFTANVEQYRTDFREGFYEAFVAEDDGRVIGMALYYFTYSTWKGRMIYLEDFVLEPAYRRRGIGRQLWDALKEKGRAKNCRLLKWQVVDTNREAMKFYAAQEGIMETNWINGKLYL